MMGLLDYAEDAGNRLKGLLARTPAASLLRSMEPGAAPAVTLNGLLGAMRSMPQPFDSSPNGLQRAYEDASAFWNPAGMLGKIVYHGSPHKFDAFNASKIGTGEGAQAYGHGLYLADSEGVAGQYKNLAPREFLDGPINWDNPIHVGIRSADLGGGVDGGIARLMRTVQARTSKPENIRIAREAIEFLRSGEPFDKYAKQGGSLYKADIPDEWIPKMLDWDKKKRGFNLEHSPPVVEIDRHVPAADGGWMLFSGNSSKPVARVNSFSEAKTMLGQKILNPSMTGEQLYKALGGGAAAAKKLQDLGIPGIRYLDGGSRSAGQGSYNYVVFPGLEDQVKILERNGVKLGGK